MAEKEDFKGEAFDNIRAALGHKAFETWKKLATEDRTSLTWRIKDWFRGTRKSR